MGSIFLQLAVCVQLALFLLHLFDIAVEGEFGDVEVLADRGSGLGDEEGTAFVEIADGLHLVLLGHNGHMLAHQTDALLDALIQQVVDIVGNGLRHCAGLHGGDEIVQPVFELAAETVHWTVSWK